MIVILAVAQVVSSIHLDVMLHRCLTLSDHVQWIFMVNLLGVKRKIGKFKFESNALLQNKDQIHKSVRVGSRIVNKISSLSCSTRKRFFQFTLKTHTHTLGNIHTNLSGLTRGNVAINFRNSILVT